MRRSSSQLASLAAQTTAPAGSPTEAATLAKYDKNRNGVLDLDERAAMESDQSTVKLSVFEGRTDKTSATRQSMPGPAVASTFRSR